MLLVELVDDVVEEVLDVVDDEVLVLDELVVVDEDVLVEDEEVLVDVVDDDVLVEEDEVDVVLDEDEVVVKLKFDFCRLRKENSAISLRVFSYYNFESAARAAVLHSADEYPHIITNRFFNYRHGWVHNSMMRGICWGSKRPVSSPVHIRHCHANGIATAALNLNPLSTRNLGRSSKDGGP